MGQLSTTAPISTTAQTSERTTSRRVIRSYAPASGTLLGEAPILEPEEVHACVARARRAQRSWGALEVAERAKRLLRFRDALVSHDDELCDLLARECGKPHQDALIQEVATTASFITYFAARAESILAPRDVPLTVAIHRKSRVHAVPRGVVGVISPWNFPLFLPLRDVVLATLAGNAVVLKPSEVTPLIALRAKEIWDAAGLPEDVFTVATGQGPTGAALIDAGIELCVFTGGVATGRRVAAACGERLIPCVMELGGKAPLIVCSDADLERAARATVFGGFVNAGQVCVSVERVYAHRDVHDAFLRRVVELTRELRVGDPLTESVDVGAITFPKQIEIAEAHIADALGKGAKLETGGRRAERPGQFFEPTVLSGCDHGMTVMREEIFGPVIPVMSVETEEEAIALANESHLALNAYLFTKDRARGERLALRIEAGSVLVNDVLTNAGVAEVPFGGFKQSGFGRLGGDESLREMCEVRHVMVDRIAPSRDPLWYPYTERSLEVARRTVRALLGGGGLLRRLSNLL